MLTKQPRSSFFDLKNDIFAVLAVGLAVLLSTVRSGMAHRLTSAESWMDVAGIGVGASWLQVRGKSIRPHQNATPPKKFRSTKTQAAGSTQAELLWGKKHTAGRCKVRARATSKGI